MDVVGSREFVMVRLAGAKSSEPLRFHVDTGGNTPGLMIRRSVAEGLGFTNADAMPHTVQIGDRDIAVPDGAKWIFVDDGDDSATFERTTRKDFSVGQLGAGFLSRFVLCVDPGHGRLGLGDPKEFNLDPAGAKWVPLLLMPRGKNHALYPFVHILLLEHGAVAGGYGLLLDTGATTSMLDRNKVDYQHRDHPDWPYANGAFGDADMLGGQFSEEIIRAPDIAFNTPGLPGKYGLTERVKIDLGPATFVDRPTGTWERMFGSLAVTMGSHGAVANDVLLRYRLVLDYPHSRLFADPSGRQSDPSASTARVGVAVRFGDDGCAEVRRVTDTNTPDTRAKIQVGDVILTIDGNDACKIFHHEITSALAGPPGTIKKLRLRRAGSTVDVDLTTAELLPGHP